MSMFGCRWRLSLAWMGAVCALTGLVGLALAGGTPNADESDAPLSTEACREPANTLMINRCLALELDLAKAEMQRYLSESLERHDQDAQLVEAIRQSQAAWQRYADAHCDAVHTQWRQGTARAAMQLRCRADLTKQRTRTLWLDFLAGMDGSSPDLPEPSNQ